MASANHSSLLQQNRCISWMAAWGWWRCFLAYMRNPARLSINHWFPLYILHYILQRSLAPMFFTHTRAHPHAHAVTWRGRTRADSRRLHRQLGEAWRIKAGAASTDKMFACAGAKGPAVFAALNKAKSWQTATANEPDQWWNMHLNRQASGGAKGSHNEQERLTPPTPPTRDSLQWKVAKVI